MQTRKKIINGTDLNFAENWEILYTFVVVSNEIYHLMPILPELLSIHWLQSTLPNHPIFTKSKTQKTKQTKTLQLQQKITNTVISNFSIYI